MGGLCNNGWWCKPSPCPTSWDWKHWANDNYEEEQEAPAQEITAAKIALDNAKKNNDLSNRKGNEVLLKLCGSIKNILKCEIIKTKFTRQSTINDFCSNKNRKSKNYISSNFIDESWKEDIYEEKTVWLYP